MCEKSFDKLFNNIWVKCIYIYLNNYLWSFVYLQGDGICWATAADQDIFLVWTIYPV